jgi:hypothetical protein
MAKVYDYKGISGYPVLLEDPRVTSNDVYFFGHLHDKDSLSPVFNVMINTAAQGLAPTAFTNMNNNIDQNQNTGHLRKDQLYLKKQTTHVNPYQPSPNTNSSSNPILDNNPWWTLDRSYEDGDNLTLLDDGSSKVLLLTAGLQVTSNTRYRYHSTVLGDSQKLSDASFTYNTMTPGSPHTNHHYTNINSISKLPNGFSCYSDNNAYYHPDMRWFAIGPTFPSSLNTVYQSTTNLPIHYQVQFIGNSLLDGSPLYFLVGRNTLQASTTVQKTVWQTTTPTVTQLYTNTSAISAGGTSSGGNKMAGNYYPASASTHFTDPRVVAETTKCWYWPYFDSNRNFHPLVYTWDQTTDTFNRETDITITGDLSSVHADMSGLYSRTASTSHICDNMICHTFVNDGNRYVMFINVDAREQYSTVPGPRTSVVYAVDAANPKLLTYHSNVTWPSTPKNVVFLNDAQTLMGMFFQNTFKLYAWNNSTGWQETVTVNKMVTACGRDADGRIWYVQSSDIYSASQPELHILTPSLPVSITIDPEFSSYDYAGTPINSYINVSAYNASGTRIAASVKIVINGGSMTFSDSTTVKTITTSTSAETQQNIIITGAGFSNITASVEI